ncbi:MAG: AAA family ATPase [Hyphomonadaceae bacterium]
MSIAAYIAFEPADVAAAEAAGAELERHGWSVVRSDPDLQRDEHAGALVGAVASSTLVVLIASPASEASVWTRREIAAALNNGRPIIIALIGDIPSDGWIASSLDLSDAIDLRGGASPEPLIKLAEAARSATGRGRVIALLNIKGGVGKTVLAANLFAAAHLADKRAVTFIDLDPQHNLTQYFLGPAERNRLREGDLTVHSVLTGSGDVSQRLPDLLVPLNRAKRGKRPVFDLISGDERLFEFTLDTRSERARAAAFGRFRTLIAALRARSDAVVIDSNPCATFLTRLAITAADHIVAPVRPEKYSLTGLNMLEHVVREVRGRALRAEEFSVVLNGVSDRTRTQDADADAITRGEIEAAPFFGSALLTEEIPYAGALRSAPTDRFAANPINVTAMMRVGGRSVKERLAHAAAAVLRRAAP